MSINGTGAVEDEVAAAKLTLAADQPYAQAEAFLDTHYTNRNVRTLHYWQESCWIWNECFYEVRSDEDIKAQIAGFLVNQVLLVGTVRSAKAGSLPVTIAPCSRHVNELLAALKTITHKLASMIEPPQWLFPGCGKILEMPNIIAVHNGLLHTAVLPVRLDRDLATGLVTGLSAIPLGSRLPTQALFCHAPHYFCLNALPVQYRVNAKCPNWLAFLSQIYRTNPSAIDLLQQIFGHLIAPDMRLQKIFLLVGPPRSGKGTVARVLRALLGGPSVAVSNLNDILGPFGLECTIGRTLLIIPDARIGRSKDSYAAMERFLSISGGDNPSIPRKFKGNYTGPIDTRLLLLCNELPDAGQDPSGAYANRMVPVEHHESFLGREDTDLFERDLLPELSGILNWALEGLGKLNSAGRFTLDEDAETLINDMENIHGGDLREFVEAKLVKDEQGIIDKDVLYLRYREWCKDREQRPKDKAHFYRDVRASGIDASHRWDPTTKTTRDSEGKKAKAWVRGYSLI